MSASPVSPGIAAPYPAGSGAQACADWCASMIGIAGVRVEAQASLMAAVHTWALERQWTTDGGMLATYPLPAPSAMLT